jgi:hypothetical protein
MPYPQKHVSAVLSNTAAQVASYSSSVVDLTLYHSASVQVTVTCSGVTWTVAIQGSNDGVNFADTAIPTAITNSTTIVLSVADLTSRFYRLNFVRTGGTLTTEVSTYCAKAQR